MYQQGDHSNNLQIGNGGAGNTFNITQSKSQLSHVLLTIDNESVREYDKEVLVKDRNIGLAKLAAGGLLGALSFLSDSIGISSHFGFSLWWLFPLGPLIGLLVAIPHSRSGQILFRLPKNRNESNFVGNNEIVQALDNRKIITYRRGAPCIYPNCSGMIVLSSAPAREKSLLGRDYVGICSLAGRDHSYRIDYIWNAYPVQFDWRPIEPNAKKP